LIVEQTIKRKERKFGEMSKPITQEFIIDEIEEKYNIYESPVFVKENFDKYLKGVILSEHKKFKELNEFMDNLIKTKEFQKVLSHLLEGSGDDYDEVEIREGVKQLLGLVKLDTTTNKYTHMKIGFMFVNFLVRAEPDFDLKKIEPIMLDMLNMSSSQTIIPEIIEIFEDEYKKSFFIQNHIRTKLIESNQEK